MAFMPWSEALELGIESIDKQHRWLVDATNRLYDETCRPAPDRAVIGSILEGLVDYTMNHFIVEEDLFLRLGYQESTGHQAEHNTFTCRLMEILLEFDAGRNVGGETMDLLKNWLQHHILQVDRAYVPFLKSHGVV